MRLSALSIERPVLATVATLLLMLFGVLSFSRLPVREYPDITFPIVSVLTVYPSADAQLVETDITSVLEDALSGVEGLRTLRSTSREGLSTIGLEFALSRNLDAAANDVRDRVARVQHLLPQGIEAPLVMKEDSESDGIMWLAVISDRHSELDITDFAQRQLKDRLAPLPGVSSVVLDGERRYAMRIWLDPDRLASRLLTVQDVEDALRTQNVSMPTGRIESTQREFSVRMGGGLERPEQFNQLILAYRDGYPVRLQDVGLAEIAAEDERKLVRVNGKPAIGLGIMKQSKANTLETARAVKRTLPSLEALLPEGMQLVTAFDSSIYIERSLHEVYEAVALSVILVVLVVFLFLRSARATLIPTVAIPGSILGTFVLMQATGSSINTITLLGFVLAIGLVVDDAIVVVENVYRRIEQGLSPTEAALEGSREIGFAVISTTLTLAAVFFPIIFLPGIVGRLFSELGIAVAGSVLLSGFIALTLTPAMCARLLSRTVVAGSPSAGSALDSSAWLQWLTRRYRAALETALQWPSSVLLAALASLAVSGLLLWVLPSELAPLEDTGWFAIHVNTPEGSTLDYTDRYAKDTERTAARIPEMDSYYTVVARGWRPTQVTRAVTWVTLKDWSDRDRVQREIVEEVEPALSAIPGASVFALNPPPFNQEDSKTPVQLVVRGPAYDVLDKIMTQVRHDTVNHPALVNIESDLDLNKPELRVDINRDKAADLGIPVETIGRTLEVFLGGRKASMFMREGKEYPVIIQTQPHHRGTKSDIDRLHVRGTQGDLIPLSNLVSLSETVAPKQLNHYEKLRAATISAGVGPGSTLSQSVESLEQIIRTHLPPGASISYAGETKEFKESSGNLHFTFVLALLVVYLILAAQFESFRHPITVLVSVPPALAGALLALLLFRGTLNIYSEIGLMILIGLVTKNAILIVEFANQLRQDGRPTQVAIVEAAALRLRPIIMTTMSTILAALPLAMATGAGAAGRWHIGLVVINGLMLSTLLTLFLVPLIYTMLAELRWRGPVRQVKETDRPEVVALKPTQS
ncbi:MAG: Efflux pump membrane transporter BepE [Nitrospirae bacterium]|nr:Efflux pump membrane transporter BepE [Nitrospirota bacterium]MCE7965773.1 efflux RND transporter permease subunit [Nitrospira sp. NTP2]MCK6494238.1 efflux RND transporter permease subunit [Nitrospira sp.]MEB2340125.1 efflux RND transporter permease subunit [Nitrospirales bacterium]RIK56548.1 MAG: multidrug transporter AcrB [Nitrospira sp.]